MDQDASDAELWRRVASGSDAAFGVIFDRHSRSIYNYAFRRLGDWAEAEDLMAATFLQVWRRWHEVSFYGDSARPWLFGVATNLVRNRWRKTRRQRAALERIPADVATSELDDLPDRLDDQRRMSVVLEKVDRLPRRHSSRDDRRAEGG